LSIVAPASAEWTIEAHRKGTNDSTIKIAWTGAKKPDRGINAKLQIECSPTGRVLTVVLSRKLTPGRFGISYRIDNRPLQERILQINPALDSIMFMDDLRQISNSRTMQVAIFPAVSQNLYYDFDISGAEKAITSVPCQT
jgi:hypothetical protein